MVSPQFAPARWEFHTPRFESDLVNPELAVSPWAGHRNFGYDFVAFRRPKRLVELGTHFGCSFFAFLQAAKDLGLDTECWAVDTWQGDEHAGYYGNEVFDIVEKTRTGSFSKQSAHLLRKLFDDARADIPDRSVDVLHIDGLHTYDAVKHDFETWEPKLADDAVVLFHDVAPSTEYGSARYWAEIKAKHPHYDFLRHSWGLGVLFPRGDHWHREIARAAPGGWQDLYRYKAESELLQIQLRAAEKTSLERWDIIQRAEAMVRDRDAALRSTEKVNQERWDVIQAMDAKLREQHDALVRTQRAEHQYRTTASAVLHSVGPDRALLAIADGDATPFADLAFSLYVFIARLHGAVAAAGVEDLFFLSREGFDLKAMFEHYDAARPGGALSVRCHYLEASRKSTFLPSLGPIDGETFEVLFRQYRRMSVADFLKSLALEEHQDEITKGYAFASELGVVLDDLPTARPFEQLIASPSFRAVYERERAKRSAALAAYVGSFTGGSVPSTLHLVDVGWKGSIQDNLFRWLGRARGEEARIRGYMIGLIAPGAMSERNEKTGLLFSNQGGLSRGFQTFNENRSLFEVLLPARHGAPRSYVLDAEGKPSVVRDPFVEQEMIESRVSGVAAHMMDRFREITTALALAPLDDEALWALTSERHRRMVLSPTPQEVEWMLGVSHVENFGVFEESRFGANGPGPSNIERIRFTRRLLQTKGPRDLGFWPYLTLRRKALFGTSAIYRQLRRWQDRSQD